MRGTKTVDHVLRCLDRSIENINFSKLLSDLSDAGSSITKNVECNKEERSAKFKFGGNDYICQYGRGCYMKDSAGAEIEINRIAWLQAFISDVQERVSGYSSDKAFVALNTYLEKAKARGDLVVGVVVDTKEGADCSPTTEVPAPKVEFSKSELEGLGEMLAKRDEKERTPAGVEETIVDKLQKYFGDGFIIAQDSSDSNKFCVTDNRSFVYKLLYCCNDSMLSKLAGLDAQVKVTSTGFYGSHVNSITLTDINIADLDSKLSARESCGISICV